MLSLREEKKQGDIFITRHNMQSTRRFHYHHASIEDYTLERLENGTWHNEEEVQVFRSYETIVALKISGTIYKDKRKYSQSTTRQVNRYINETVRSFLYVIEVDHETFKSLLKRIDIS